MSPEEYIELVSDWEDPYPTPVIEKHNKFLVLRDDLLEGGSKIRFLDFLIQSKTDVKEWVYGSSPAGGYGQISISFLCKKYGKQAVIVAPERKKSGATLYQQKAIDLGAKYIWIKSPAMLSVTLKRARDYVSEKPLSRCELPFGLAHPSVIGSLIKVARNLPIKPKEFWTVASSGQLNFGLQLAFPDAQANMVQVGRKLKERDIGRAKLYISEYKFDQEVKEWFRPPFPSDPSYDAKGWRFMELYGNEDALFWNVGK